MKFLLYYLCFSSNLVLSRVCSIGRDVYMYCKLSIKIFGTMKNKKHTKRRKKNRNQPTQQWPKIYIQPYILDDWRENKTRAQYHTDNINIVCALHV